MTFRQFIKAAIVVSGLITLVVAQRPAGRREGPPPPPAIEHILLRLLDLSAAQNAQLKAGEESAAARLAPLQMRKKAAQDVLAEAIAPGEFNETRVQAAAAALAQTETELLVEHARQAAALTQILTPEQHAQFAQWRERLRHAPPASALPPPHSQPAFKWFFDK